MKYHRIDLWEYMSKYFLDKGDSISSATIKANKVIEDFDFQFGKVD